MGFFVKLVGLAVAAGAGYASVKVAKKYDENKQKAVMDDDFDSVTPETTTGSVKQAAKDVYEETTEKVKSTVVTTAENIGIDTEEIGKAFSEAGSAAVGVGKSVANASVKVAEKVKEEAPVVIDSAKEFVEKTAQQVKEKISAKPDITDAEIYAEEVSEEEIFDEDVSEEVETTEETETTEEVDPFEDDKE